MKAIQTHYKGYKFRSRIEARWAVFFDAYGVIWEYEQEGFKLSDGSNYLPDFYFPKKFHGFSYAEVKRPLTFTDKGQNIIEESDLLKFKQFCIDIHKDNQSAILLDGTPDLTQYYSYEECYYGPGQVEYSWMDYAFCAGDGNYMGDCHDSSDYFVCSGMTRDELKMDFPGGKDWFGQAYIDAVNKARSARFEHGEKP